MKEVISFLVESTNHWAILLLQVDLPVNDVYLACKVPREVEVIGDVVGDIATTVRVLVDRDWQLKHINEDDAAVAVRVDEPAVVHQLNAVPSFFHVFLTIFEYELHP